MRHDFAVTGGYDPGLDGPWPEWGRLAVECSQCGETRRIWRGLPLADAGLTYGCPAGWVTLERQPADVVPELAELLAAARARHRAGVAVTLASALLLTLWVVCVSTGAWPPAAVTWGWCMADAGLITWGIVAARRPPAGLGSGHGEQAAGGVHGEPGGGDSWQPGPRPPG